MWGAEQGKTCNGIKIRKSEGYIDHQSMFYGENNIEKFLYKNNISSIEDFIFNGDYNLHIDNDNH